MFFTGTDSMFAIVQNSKDSQSIVNRVIFCEAYLTFGARITDGPFLPLISTPVISRNHFVSTFLYVRAMPGT